MRVFVTGAGGHIGSAVVSELIKAGHEVVGLARSDTSAGALKALGAEVRRGEVGDLDGLREAALAAHAVIHLAYDHAAVAAGDPAGAAAADLTVVQALGDAMAGTGKTLMGVGTARTGNERLDAALEADPRSAVARTVAGFAERGIRSLLMAIPPAVHSRRDRHGFVPTLIRIARETGISAYVGDGTNRWPAAHVLDVGRLYRLALEKAPAGSQLCAAAEEGVPLREIAATIGLHLGVPAVSIPAEQAVEHFGPFARYAALDLTMPSKPTQQMLDWHPIQPGLIADLDQGHYFTVEGPESGAADEPGALASEGLDELASEELDSLTAKEFDDLAAEQLDDLALEGSGAPEQAPAADREMRAAQPE